MKNRLNIWVIFFVSIILSSIAFGEFEIAVIDFSGDMATFYDPDSVLGYIHPVTAVQNSFNHLLELVGEEYEIREELSIEYFYELPEDISDYNLLYILFGWEGSGEHVLTASEALALEVYLMGGAPGNDRALVIEGNNFCENYGDTSSSHYTYIDLMDYFAVTLREPTGTPYYELYGQIGSFAEGMYFPYPHRGTGPGNDPDDIIINE